MVMAKGVEDDFELEAKLKEDSSWHPCQVYLSSGGSTSSGLTVDFGGQYSEDVLFSEEEVLARIRFRSNPLQGDDCSHIKEGDRVLASPKTQSKSVFFDAEVEKVYRVRHSKKIHCRCTFEVKWIFPEFQDGNVTVTSGSIMKISKTKIDSHPTVAAFLNSVRTLNCSDVSLIMCLDEDPVCETDIPIMLEKQIEDVVKLANAPKEGFLKSKGHAPQPLLEECNRAHLSPLGARAALASLVQESLYNASENTTNNEEGSTGGILDVTRTLDFDVCINDKATTEKDLLSTEERYPAEVASKLTDMILALTSESFDEKCASTSKSSWTKQSSKKIIRKEKPIQMFDEQEDEKSNICSVEKRLTRSTAGKNVTCSLETTQLTRSAVHRRTRSSSNNVVLKPSTEGTAAFPTLSTRLTRSSLQKEGKLLKLNKGLEASKLAEDTHTDSTKRNDISVVVKKTRMKKPLSSPVELDVNLYQAQENNKKQRVFDISQNSTTKGEVSDSGGGRPEEKKTSSQKTPELRFSHRLRFHPRTRSQTKYPIS